MKIGEYEAIIFYIKNHYPNLVDKFEIWHDFDEETINPELWAVYWGYDFNDPLYYKIYIKLVKHFSSKVYYNIEEKRILITDLKQQPKTYLQRLERIVASIRDCDDGGDIKYIVNDAEEILKERKQNGFELSL